MSKELVERLRKMGNGYAEPMIGDYDEAADEIERLNGIIEEMADCLNDIADMYADIAHSGDCGSQWNPEEESEVMAARAMISKAHKVKE